MNAVDSADNSNNRPQVISCRHPTSRIFQYMNGDSFQTSFNLMN
jgi:hypothetical protein